MEVKDLIGKTIADAKMKEVKGYDDEAWLELTFSDGTKICIEAGYGGYTGGSIGEYPAYLILTDNPEEYFDEGQSLIDVDQTKK